MQDDIEESKEEEKAPTKKVKTREDGSGKDAQTMYADLGVEVAEHMESEIHEEGAPATDENTGDMDEVMSLGSTIFQISQMDPVIKRWAEEIGKKNEAVKRDIDLSLASRDVGAVSTEVSGCPRQVDVSEVYSPPRVTIMATKTGLTPGSAMDLRTGYDFNQEK